MSACSHWDTLGHALIAASDRMLLWNLHSVEQLQHAEEQQRRLLNATHCRVTLIGLDAMGTVCSLYRDREAQKE